MRTPIRMASREKESDIQKTILEGLSALRIWHTRMNSGAMFGEYRGKKRMLRFGRKGMADILVIGKTYAPHSLRLGVYLFMPTWIEVKRPREKQTPDQLAFQVEVEAEGHHYLVAHSWEEVLAALQEV
jgi:hypothetical protein